MLVVEPKPFFRMPSEVVVAILEASGSALDPERFLVLARKEIEGLLCIFLKAGTEHDITVYGPELAAQAIGGGLVDEFQMIVCPVVVGGGKRFFPDGVRLNLELVEERRFGNGVVGARID
jgi:dihydrofolate reductase